MSGLPISCGSVFEFKVPSDRRPRQLLANQQTIVVSPLGQQDEQVPTCSLNHCISKSTVNHWISKFTVHSSTKLGALPTFSDGQHASPGDIFCFSKQYSKHFRRKASLARPARQSGRRTSSPPAQPGGAQRGAVPGCFCLSVFAWGAVSAGCFCSGGWMGGRFWLVLQARKGNAWLKGWNTATLTKFDGLTTPLSAKNMISLPRLSL